ncbi:serine kinase [uncultured Tateyamaria sp.]|uniref:HPr kinase/phosphorylase n=1 Tax=uncultured Tateyamaria sp. TaxID=455651 RepID=UPI0026328BA2|nr:serine kinase [uncultured Tateyamaria sp.]
MPGPLRLHASAVAVDGQGVLILGASGSGKSSLALQLIALGAALVADDQTVLTVRSGAVHLSAPETIAGLIEARGVGLLRVPVDQAPLALVIDLDRAETQRLPLAHSMTLLDRHFPCLHKVDNAAWPAAILLYLKGGRKDPE